MKRKIYALSKKIIFLLLLLGLWSLASYWSFWPSWIFPSPRSVGVTLYEGFQSGVYGWAVLVSLRRLAIGFGLSIVFGSLIGFLLAKVQLAKETVGFLVLGLQTLPSICWLPLSLLWFGLNETAIIFVIFMGAVLSTTISVEGAIRSIPSLYLRAGTMLGAKGWTMYRYVIFPAILPAFLIGLKQAWSFAWRSLMAGEMLFITVGLGQLLMAGRDFNDMSQVIAVMLVIIAIGVVGDRLLFNRAELRLRQKWGWQKN